MKTRLVLLFNLFFIVSAISQTRSLVIKSNTTEIVFCDGDNAKKESWTLAPEIKPDIYFTHGYGHKVSFITDVDSISFMIEKNGVYDFVIVNGNDSAYTQIRWAPSKEEIIKMNKEKNEQTRRESSTERILTRAQAISDIDTLVYILSEVHPNIYSSCTQTDFLQTVDDVKNKLPDSLNKTELYKLIAPLVSMIDDGHTNLYPPAFLSRDTTSLFFPISVDINTSDSTVIVSDDYSLSDNRLLSGTEILSINNIECKEIVNNMLRYLSGEKTFFKLKCVSNTWPILMALLYPATEYDIQYKVRNVVADKKVTAITNNQMNDKNKTSNRLVDYSFTINDNNIAVMTFNSFVNPDRFRLFADSMFTVLKKKKVENLIIDIRNNSGGNSIIGDELFQYISSVPFQQFGGSIMRITPETKKLISDNYYIAPEEVEAKYKNGITIEFDNTLIELRDNPLRFKGNVYLLISHNVFSSAASFSWAFKQFKMGTVIGEESGGMNIAFGDILPFYLPISKLVGTVSYKRFYQYGAKEDDIHGTIPDYVVSSDNALDYTLDLIDKLKKINSYGNK